MKHPKYRLLVFWIAASFVCGAVYGGDWAEWRGSNGNGISSETQWNPKALEDTPEILWEADLGYGHSTVAVQGNYLYTMSNQRRVTDNDSIDFDIIFCLNATTGREIWQYAFPEAPDRWPGPGATPVVNENRVFTTSRTGDLYCFNTADGSVLWKRNLVEEGLSLTPNWGFCSSALIVDDILLINAAESGLAFDKTTGEIAWKSESGRGNLATPVLFNANGKQLAAILGARQLNAVEVKTGHIAWSFDWSAYTDPIMFNDKMYISSGRGLAVLENLSQDPKVIWNNRGIRGTSFISFVVIDDHAYGICAIRREHHLQCVDVNTGEAKWNTNLGLYGSLMAAAGKLIILDGDGDLIIAEANPEAYTVISSARLFDIQPYESYPSGAPNWCWTAPVLANGKIYARTTYGNLVCVDVSL